MPQYSADSTSMAPLATRITGTNDGTAAVIAVETSTLVSAQPGRSAAITPLPIPTTRMMSAA